MQTRQSTSALTVYTLELTMRTIPAKAILHDFRVGPGHEELAPHNPDVASFHHDGLVYFNVVHEVIGKTLIVSTEAELQFRLWI